MWIVVALGLGFVLLAMGEDTPAAKVEEEEDETPAHTGPVTTFHLGDYTVQIGELATPTLGPNGGDPMRWEWTVWQTAVYDEHGDDLGGREEARGEAPQRDDAVGDAHAWIEQDAGAKIPLPTPGQVPWQSTGPGTGGSRTGLRINADCSAVDVDDLDKWITYAAPILRKYNPLPDAGTLMSEMLASVFPECGGLGQPTIRGESWITVTTGLQNMLDKIAAGEFLAVESPAEALAARLVGMSVPHRDGTALFHVGKHTGERYAIVVDQIAGTPIMWRWRAWTGSRSGEAEYEGTADSLAHGLQAARARVDSIFMASVLKTGVTP